MKKIMVGVGIGVLTMSAFAAGWFASGVQLALTTKVPAPQKVQSAAVQTSAEVVNVETGNGMTTSRMYEELQKTSGADFDRRYTMYALLMRSDLVAISRLAKDRATNEEIKTKAARMWTDDSPIVSELYNLQHRLGYSHH